MYRWIEHTAELELELEAAEETDVFLDAAAAFRELVGDSAHGDLEERQVEVRAESREVLLAEWLGELAYLSETQGFIAERVSKLALDDGVLRVTLHGRRGDSQHLVKAVTLHRLSFVSDGDGWKARVVLDV